MRIENKTLRLTDLLDSEVGVGGPAMRGLEAYDCHFYGPAIIMSVDGSGTRFNKPTLDVNGTGTEGILWEIDWEVRPNGVIGPVSLDGCYFLRCTFTGIGFAGTHDALMNIVNNARVT